MVLKDLHVHTNYCDGKDSPEAIVLAALEMGMTALGFSGHSYVCFDEESCMSRQGTENYKKEIAYLKKKYEGRIEILCGIEQDIFSEESTQGYDYVIGSNHYLNLGGEFISIDWTPQILKDAAEKYFNGDMLSLAESYYETVSDVAEKTHCDIVGHIDLITKFNEKEKLFDINSHRYIAAYESAIDKIMRNCTLFEINTGAISRGYRTSPYPDKAIIDYIKKQGGQLILSGDSHNKEGLCCCFDKFEHLL